MWGFEVVLGRGRWRIKPAGYIHYPYAISIVFVMSCPCQKHFGIGIFYLKKWLRLPCQCRFGRDVVTDLYVELFTAFHCDEVNLFLVEFPHIYIVSSAKQLKAYDVLIDMSVVQVPLPQHSIAECMVDQIVLPALLKVFLSGFSRGQTL